VSGGSVRRELTDRELEHAARLYAEGRNARQVARALGISRTTAAQLAARLQDRITQQAKAGAA
jgi:DNA-binding CsgD family transcriptional regulator